MMPYRGTDSSARNCMCAADFIPGQGSDRGSLGSSGVWLGGVIGQHRTSHFHHEGYCQQQTIHLHYREGRRTVNLGFKSAFQPTDAQSPKPWRALVDSNHRPTA